MQVDRVYVAVRKVSASKMRCACVSRDFTKILGIVDQVESVANKGGLSTVQPASRDIGAHVYTFFRKYEQNKHVSPKLIII